MAVSTGIYSYNAYQWSARRGTHRGGVSGDNQRFVGPSRIHLPEPGGQAQRLCPSAPGRYRVGLRLPVVHAIGVHVLAENKNRGNTRREEERRVGKECVSTGRSRWST